MLKRAALSDYNELLAFENKVFGIDFLTMVPKLYTDPAVCTSCHGILRENGRITAAVAALPGALNSVGGTLRAVGVGSVAVGEEARGRGLLGELMAFCDRAAEETDADLAFLGGARGRYEHFGYRPCGERVNAEVSPYILSHAAPKERFSFVPLRAHAQSLAAAEVLFEAQPVRWCRSESGFLCVASTWEAETFGVLDAAGESCGYLIFERRHSSVTELVLRDYKHCEDVLTAFAKEKELSTLTVSAAPTQPALTEALLTFAEYITVQMPAAFKIFNLRRVIEVLGSCRAQLFALPQGSLVLQAGNERLRLTVKNGTCTAEPTEAAPDVVYSKKAAAVALTTSFGKLSPHPLFASWAPLCPLGQPHADEC